nr:hypothetical protein [Planctomycetota bacterium]
LEGELLPDRVRLRLRPLPPADLVVVEDPPSLAFLEQLPGSPGSWSFEYDLPAPPAADPVGDQLRDLFGGREELP